ncbi:aminoglycoside phosphotransferase family protein [Streptomyces griseoincarnatus]|uniref:Aminoglycoside phosphotransferase family protein n=1 Tax=Streptomyces griseoincarnatus TaxID=29305 RepID=A0ABT0W5Z7_STRGI|nr:MULTISPECIES: aminoglycoside phosphotransferase family protein [Streptomyces]MBJ6614490.1 kinase [Streptomyces sp. I3(2020)]MBJ6624768.1 kinase [Streptomyces sp. I4(2020)]MCM2518036.1 aminoglycoside phosphotransferase family protein [Streptomyces griseoincarnatus]
MAFEPPRRLVRALGETAPEGDDWLEKLPGLAREAVDRRELTVERVQLPGGRSSLVVLVRTAHGTPAVLKLAPPRARPESERVALAHWGGLGAVQLLEPVSEGTEGVLLLERLQPDVSVRTLPEAKALLEAAGTLRRLWVDPPEDHVFETVAERTGRQAKAMRAGADAAPDVAPLVDAALSAREELLDSPPEHRLLHGTFRQSKVLSGDRMPWLAVGPDPVVGEHAFDLARLVRDRVEDLIAQPSGATTTRRRVRRLAESLEVDRERLRGWTLFRAVESGVRARRVGRERDAELLLEFATWL